MLKEHETMLKKFPKKCITLSLHDTE